MLFMRKDSEKVEAQCSKVYDFQRVRDEIRN